MSNGAAPAIWRGIALAHATGAHLLAQQEPVCLPLISRSGSVCFIGAGVEARALITLP